MPKRTVPVIEEGILIGPVTDSYWASRTGSANTGHALPAPNPYGPFALDLEVSSGDASVDEMIASVDRGVYVTRFHYVNLEDPTKTVLTGMTRDGTFAIESGRLGRPLKNLRFTQSAIEALANVRAVGSHRQAFGDGIGAKLAPALLVEDFRITGQTD
jgi:predicted Zn-dependent protease